jgi:hypothetical protein
VEWLKVKALSSNLSTTKKKILKPKLADIPPNCTVINLHNVSGRKETRLTSVAPFPLCSETVGLPPPNLVSSYQFFFFLLP